MQEKAEVRTRSLERRLAQLQIAYDTLQHGVPREAKQNALMELDFAGDSAQAIPGLR
jgi:hypothetical protein